MKTIGKKFLSIFAIALIASFTLTSCDEESDPVEDLLEEELMTIVGIASADTDFSTLVTALTEAELVATLQGDGPFSVFAPTNAAFNKLVDGVVELLLENPTVLAEVLQYHVVSGNVMSTDLTDVPVHT